MKLIQSKNVRPISLGISIILICASASHGFASQLRPFRLDDMLRMEGIGETSLSPDGRWVAYVIKRAKATEMFRGYSALIDNDHADVWIASITGEPPKNITNGAHDGSGYWAPRWSPDGQRLAMLSTKGGNVRLWLWTKSSRRLEMLSDHAVDRINPEGPWEPYVWVSEKELVVGAMPLGKKPLAMIDKYVTEALAPEWTKAWKGQEPTASVLDSGVPVVIDNRPQGQLLIIDVTTRTERTIATGASFGQFVLSPCKRRLAFLKQVGVWHPDPDKELTALDPAIYQVMVTDLQGRLEARRLTGVQQALQGSLLWSPDATELALIGSDKKPSPGALTIFRCRVADARCQAVSDEMRDLDPYKQQRFSKPPMMWFGNRELLVFSRIEDKSSEGDELQPRRWWAIDEQGHRRDLFHAMREFPTQILPEAETEDLIGIVDGSVWRINRNGQLLKKVVAPDFTQKITSILWTDHHSSAAVSNVRTRPLIATDPVENLFIVRVDSGPFEFLYEVDLKTGKALPVLKPSPEAILIGSKAGTYVFFAANHTGMYIWAKPSETNRFVPIAAINTFLYTIGYGEPRKIEYRSLDGQMLKAWVILPYPYNEGKRYPTVVWVYPGTIYGEKPPRLWFDTFSPFNLQILAGHGYAVLLPSMPLKSYGEIADPYFELTKGVLPAVDRLVDLKIADPERVGVMGHSFGGYSTYGLITQSKRFRAAVALAGLADLVSLYGTFGSFEGGGRYEEYAHENPFRMWNLETIGMGSPPWKDLGRYLRNSPINYVERVETPLMIIQGDFDFIGIEQGEEFFTALYRQNKRARFVRYWGEDHSIKSPANIRDMWHRILDWFDEYLADSKN